MAADNDPRVKAADGALAAWRQGDCVIGEHWFVHRLDKEFSVTESGNVAAQQDIDLAEQKVFGFVVVTQTCDIVRSCAERPFLEVCPLVEVSSDHLLDIQRGRRPAYAYLPLLAGSKLVADLDRTMTVEKPVAAGWTRTIGWTTDEEGRAFALALARKRVRFAFPDSFTALVRKLHNRLSEKHGKHTDEGRGLRALREIRVQASPRWDAPSVEVFFWFIRHDHDAQFEGRSWAELLQDWLKHVPPADHFALVDGQVVTLQDMTAADYVYSDPLDLDYLSSRSAP